MTFYNLRGRALGKAKSRESNGAWRWRSYGSVRSHVRVSYDDGPLDIFECNFTIRDLFVNDGIRAMGYLLLPLLGHLIWGFGV